jgi:hypothetical protein
VLPASMASWLQDVTLSGAWQDPCHHASITAWLDAITVIARAPQLSVQHLKPIFVELTALLVRAARPFRRPFTAPLPTKLQTICLRVSAVAVACPGAAAALAAAPDCALSLVSHALLTSLSASLDHALCPALAARAALGSLTASVERESAWGAATDAVHSLSALARSPSTHRSIVVNGLDCLLVSALTKAPALRCPADESELMSHGMAAAVSLLRARMRWPGVAPLLLGMGQASSVDVSTSALLALLRCLFRGCASHERCVLRVWQLG